MSLFLNDKNQNKNDKHHNSSSFSMRNYDFLHPIKNEPQSSVTVSKKNMSNNHYIAKETKRDKSFPANSSFCHKRNDEMYNRSKNKAELLQRKIDYQRTIKKQYELKEMKPCCNVNDVSRNLHAKKLERSKTSDVPLYQRNKEKILEKHTMNLKQLIAKECIYKNQNKSQKTFEKKEFEHWIKKNEQWQKSILEKTKVRMIELEEETEQYDFKPKINEKSRNSSFSNDHSCFTTSQSCKSILNLRKEYYKMQSIPSFRPMTNNNKAFLSQKYLNSNLRKDSSISSISTNRSKRSSNKGILLKLKPSSFQTNMIEIDKEIAQSDWLNCNIFKSNSENKKIFSYTTIEHSQDNIASHNNLYSLNIRDHMPNQIALNIIVCKEK